MPLPPSGKFGKTHDIITASGKTLWQENRAGVGGRPVLWKDTAELEAKITEYDQYCRENEKPFNMSGLAYYIGIDRNTLLNYSYKDEFFSTLQRAKRRCEMEMENGLLSGKAQIGYIFTLKNNAGWKDKSEIEHNHTLTMADVLGQFTKKSENIIEGEAEEQFLAQPSEKQENDEKK